MSILNSAELAYYARHIALSEFGQEGQEKLKKAKVLVVGAGGLGSPVLMYLAAAGIGQIGIVDDDIVEVTNLQRQILYTNTDIGKSKVVVAKNRLLARNPHIEVATYPFKLTKDNALHLFTEYDIIVDGTDNFATRYLVNDATVLAEKILVHAAISKYEGQVAVFNYPQKNGERGANYRDLFPQPPKPGAVLSCAEAGVLGVLPGIIGTIQANEVIKIITGIGQTLDSRLFVFNLQNLANRILDIKKNPDTQIKELIDYDLFCNMKNDIDIQEITAKTIQEWQAEKVKFEILDVRTEREFRTFNIGGIHIPLEQLEARINEIDPSQKWVVVCKVGKRSFSAITNIQSAHPSIEIYNLKGGLVRWPNR